MYCRINCEKRCGMRCEVRRGTCCGVHCLKKKRFCFQANRRQNYLTALREIRCVSGRPVARRETEKLAPFGHFGALEGGRPSTPTEEGSCSRFKIRNMFVSDCRELLVRLGGDSTLFGNVCRLPSLGSGKRAFRKRVVLRVIKQRALSAAFERLGAPGRRRHKRFLCLPLPNRKRPVLLDRKSAWRLLSQHTQVSRRPARVWLRLPSRKRCPRQRELRQTRFSDAANEQRGQACSGDEVCPLVPGHEQSSSVDTLRNLVLGLESKPCENALCAPKNVETSRSTVENEVGVAAVTRESLSGTANHSAECGERCGNAWRTGVGAGEEANREGKLATGFVCAKNGCGLPRETSVDGGSTATPGSCGPLSNKPSCEEACEDYTAGQTASLSEERGPPGCLGDDVRSADNGDLVPERRAKRAVGASNADSEGGEGHHEVTGQPCLAAHEGGTTLSPTVSSEEAAKLPDTRDKGARPLSCATAALAPSQPAATAQVIRRPDVQNTAPGPVHVAGENLLKETTVELSTGFTGKMSSVSSFLPRGQRLSATSYAVVANNATIQLQRNPQTLSETVAFLAHVIAECAYGMKNMGCTDSPRDAVCHERLQEKANSALNSLPHSAFVALFHNLDLKPEVAAGLARLLKEHYGLDTLGLAESRGEEPSPIAGSADRSCRFHPSSLRGPSSSFIVCTPAAHVGGPDGFGFVEQDVHARCANAFCARLASGKPYLTFAFFKIPT